jgi:hypothetical protein
MHDTLKRVFAINAFQLSPLKAMHDMMTTR